MAEAKCTRLVHCPHCKRTAEGYATENIPYCRDCWRAYSRRYREAHKPQFAAYKRKWTAKNKEAVSRNNRASRARHGARYNLNKKIGGASTYEQLFALQNGVCAICKEPEKCGRYKTLSVDHCHETGAIRGLLCNTCNRAIGLLKDSAAALRAAADYLEIAR